MINCCLYHLQTSCTVYTELHDGNLWRHVLHLFVAIVYKTWNSTLPYVSCGDGYIM